MPAKIIHLSCYTWPAQHCWKDDYDGWRCAWCGLVYTESLDDELEYEGTEQ